MQVRARSCSVDRGGEREVRERRGGRGVYVCLSLRRPIHTHIHSKKMFDADPFIHTYTARRYFIPYIDGQLSLGAIASIHAYIHSISIHAYIHSISIHAYMNSKKICMPA